MSQKPVKVRSINEELVIDNTKRTQGYISAADAAWVGQKRTISVHPHPDEVDKAPFKGSPCLARELQIVHEEEVV